MSGEADGTDAGERRDSAEDGAIARTRAGALGWLRSTNHSPELVSLLRRARRSPPGDPEFGDPLSSAGFGGPRVAARAADRLLDRDAASREVSLGALQVWQALSERVSGRPANPEVTLVFTDLVGFSEWSLSAGDDDTLRLLRRVAQVTEPPMLAAGGRIVKRMGDGVMAVFPDPVTAVASGLIAYAAVKTVEVAGHTPRMRVGMHTGHPHRLGSDWLGVDVNIAARVMEQATRGGVVVSQPVLDGVGTERLDELGVDARRLRQHRLFASRIAGVPEDLAMYRLRGRPDGHGGDGVADSSPGTP